MQRESKKSRYKYLALLLIPLMLVPWLFYATIPDILTPPKAMPYLAPEPVYSYDPIPADAPIQVQYEAYPLTGVLDWLRRLHPDTLIDMPMLQTIDQVCQAKNVSLGLMLGIINAEHSLLSLSVLMRGGMTQVIDAPLNPFSYGWTSPDVAPQIGVQRSAAGAAGIISSAVHSWMQNGWGYMGTSQFLQFLAKWYVNGPNAIAPDNNAKNWAINVASTASSLAQYMSEHFDGWKAEISAKLAQGVRVMGATSIATNVLAKVPTVMAKGWDFLKDAAMGIHDKVASLGPKIVAALGVGGAIAAGIDILFEGLGILAIGAAAL